MSDPNETKMQSFQKELEQLINRYSVENHSNTPDFILAEYIDKCLSAFSHGVVCRDQWYGIKPEPGGKR